MATAMGLFLAGPADLTKINEQLRPDHANSTSPVEGVPSKDATEAVMRLNGDHTVNLGSTNLSRRQMLRTTALAAGAVAVLFGMASPAEAKMSYQAAGYQPTPKGDQNCANCSLFKSPSSCILVEGEISPNGWCRFYRKKS